MKPLIHFDPSRIPKRLTADSRASKCEDATSALFCNPSPGVVKASHTPRSYSALECAEFHPALQAEVKTLLTENHYPASYATVSFVSLVFDLCKDHLHYAMPRERTERLEEMVLKMARQTYLGFLSCA